MIQSIWKAPYIADKANGGKIDAQIEVPASKSLTNRYLVLEALSAEPSQITNVLEARDTDLMKNAISLLKDSRGYSKKQKDFKQNDVIEINVGLAGTVMRFVPPLALFIAKPGTIVKFNGDEGAKVRPILPILDALEQLGVKITKHNGDFLPFKMLIPEVKNLNDKVEIDASKSSQFISALLLCGADFPNGLEIAHTKNTVPSQAHIDMTIDCLKKCGVDVITSKKDGKICWEIKHQNIITPNLNIEPDLSNAGPFICSVLANPNGGKIKIPFWPRSSTQPGKRFIEILEKMGAQCQFEYQTNEQFEQTDDTLQYTTLNVSSSGKRPQAISINLKNEGEITPTVAALCTLASGSSVISGIGHLRGHETDRLNALVTEIKKVGRNAFADDDNLYIDQMPEDGLKPALIKTYHDHRMATFGAILGLGIKGIEVENIETVSKTMPKFVDLWQKMLENTTVKN